jgi:hypothetical protein
VVEGLVVEGSTCMGGIRERKREREREKERKREREREKEREKERKRGFQVSNYTLY